MNIQYLKHSTSNIGIHKCNSIQFVIHILSHQQNQTMAFSLSNNSIASKIRQEMYLRHMREVEKINNRDPDTLKKQLKEYRCISQLHKNNKDKSNILRVSSKDREMKYQNQKIHTKILSISSDHNIKQKIRSSTNSFDKSQHSQSVYPITQAPERKRSLHYRYRKRQHDHQIQQQNIKLAKAILSQRSTLLPLINPHRKKSSITMKSEIKQQTAKISQISIQDNPEIKNNE